MTDTDEPTTIWIKTDMPPGATNYVVTLASADIARILTPDEALTYAAGVLAASARAEYDAAVLRQLTSSKLKLPMEAAAEVISGLRKDRPPLDPEITYPFTFEPGVTKAGKPFVKIICVGEPTGQWDAADGRSHAMGVLESVAVADLDSAYLRALVGAIGLDRARAMNVVDDLANYRELEP